MLDGRCRSSVLRCSALRLSSLFRAGDAINVLKHERSIAYVSSTRLLLLSEAVFDLPAKCFVP